MFRLSILLMCVTCVSNQIRAQETWKWSDENSTILHYFMLAPNIYQFELIRGVMSNHCDLEVRINNGAHTLHSWKTHPAGAFLVKDTTVVYANFSMISTGCELRAFDLEQQKELWRTPLDGLGLIKHSEYRNRINMELRSDRVVVYGNESSGQYIESRDLKTGELIDHVIGKGQYGRFKEQ